MNRIWRWDVLKFVDAWACRAGTPEDEEEERARVLREKEQGAWGLDRQDVTEMGFLEQDRAATGRTREQDDGEVVQEQAQ
jgi:hypothetical protein